MIQLNLTYLQTISGGDQSFIKEMLKMFLNTTFPEVEVLKLQANEQSWEKMGATAHKMKAPIQMLGVPVVSDLILNLEMTGKHQENLESVPEKIKQLEGYLAEIERLIKEILLT